LWENLQREGGNDDADKSSGRRSLSRIKERPGDARHHNSTSTYKKTLIRGRAIRVKILLADDHKIFRDGLRMLIGKEPDMEVVAEADDGRTAIELAKQLSPDIVIMDITMPDMNGIDATRAILKESPETRVIGLSMHSDRRLTSAMLEAGASSYLTKDCTFEELLTTIVNAGNDKFQPRNA
jgi:DNA-binding NarL/FixJ family response regulator